MSRKRSASHLPPIGLSSLLVIFAVLCLLTFALLTVSTVEADSRLHSKSEQAMLDHYAADRQAQELLARIRAGEVPENVKENNGIYTYSCVISDTQTLVVEVEADGTEYHILRWQAVSTGSTETDDHLPVWDGREGESQP